MRGMPNVHKASVAQAVDGEQPAPGHRRLPRRAWRRDAIALAGLLTACALTAVRMRGLIVRPLWFDESWRAWHLTGPSLDLRSMYSPATLGWLLAEKSSVAVLGNHDWALRVPSAFAVVAMVVATYATARSWLRPLPSGLVAGALLINPALLAYGFQLKPMGTDALFAVVILLAWIRLPVSTPWWRLLRAVALGALATCSIAGAFVLAALLTLDLLTAVRRGQAGRTAIDVTVAGAIVLLHAATVIRLQTFLLHYPSFWDPWYLPHHPAAAAQVAARELAGFFPELLTGAAGNPDSDVAKHFESLLPPLLTWGAAVAQLVAAGLGARVALATRAGRGLLAAVAGTLVIQLGTSWLQLWPFGFVRVNIFLVPLWYLLLGLGAAAAARVVGRRAWPLARLAGAVLLVVLLVVVPYDLRAAGTVAYRARTVPRFNGNLRAVVATARQLAQPGTLAVVDLEGHHGFGPQGKGWRYYMERYEEPSRQTRNAPRIPAADTLFLDEANPEALRGFLAAHPGPTRLLAYYSQGVRPVMVARLEAIADAAGYRPVLTRDFTTDLSGTLVLYARPDPGRGTGPVSTVPASA